ncbi:MAG: HAMP domain-containing protein [Alphaproteobacteria bacterium]|nr:HAMP domain-containing protein [Alphaproteobacteria bacterium]
MSFAWTRLVSSESFRLTAIFTSVIIVAMLGLMGLVYAITHRALETELFSAIDRDIASIQSGYRAQGISEAKEVITQHLYRGASSDFLLLQTTGGRKLAGNLPVMNPRLGRFFLRLPARAATPEGESLRILGEGVMLAPGLYMFDGRNLDLVSDAEEDVLAASLWVLVASLVLAVGGGLVLSHLFLARMDAITDTCRAIMAGRFSDRVPERGAGDELGRLVRTINAMLDRISGLMENVQQISSDIAHDMRAPLTHLHHRLERALSEARSEDEYRAAIEHALQETDLLLGTFHALLKIGQLEEAVDVRSLPRLDLSHLLEEMVDIYRPVAEDSAHVLTGRIAPGLWIHGDRTLLAQLVANLIENARAHTPAGSHITLQAERHDSEVVMMVRDDGPGIPKSEYERVFRRFYRLERSRTTAGTGLGLPLVAAIARYHGAKIALEDNAPGLIVRVGFVPAEGTR